MIRWVCVLILAVSHNVMALNQGSVDLLGSPTLLLSKGRYVQAAASFHQQANKSLTQERQLGAKNMWLTAGLAEGLAAIAAEKSGDPIAYEYWANSVRYFLMGGSDWKSLQQRLHQEYEQSNSRLAVSSGHTDIGYEVDDLWLQMFSLIEVWNERLNYFSYQSPSGGLVKKKQHRQTANEAPNRSEGYQLKQYSPNSKLMLDSGFESKQTFVVEPVLNDSISTTADDNSQERNESGEVSALEENVLSSEGKTVVDTPAVSKQRVRGGALYVQIDDEEQEHTAIEVLEKEASESSDQDVISTPIAERHAIEEEDMGQTRSVKQLDDSKQISRGNLESSTVKPVQASQRRSFVPITE